MHVGLLACDEVAERFRRIAGGYQQMFVRLLSPHVPGLRLARFDLQAGRRQFGKRLFDRGSNRQIQLAIGRRIQALGAIHLVRERIWIGWRILNQAAGV